MWCFLGFGCGLGSRFESTRKEPLMQESKWGVYRCILAREERIAGERGCWRCAGGLGRKGVTRGARREETEGHESVFGTVL